MGATPDADNLIAVRDRLDRAGPLHLEDRELLALLLESGRGAGRGRGVAEELLSGTTLSELGRADPREWCRLPGIGPALAARLCAAFEIGRRCGPPAPSRRTPVRTARDLAPGLMNRYGPARHEVFGVVLLDGRNRILRTEAVSMGGWSASVVRPREVFRQALLSASPALILFHNHPSGDPTPSPEDFSVTARLESSGKTLGIQVLDHIVLGKSSAISIREAR